MKKGLLLFLITFISVNCYSQITFEKGYYINNSNQKIDCFIKNGDWLNNPLEFQYKLTETSETQKATIKTIKEFGVNSIFKFSRHTVNIDRSSSNINEISNVKRAVFKEETLFLKVLVEGEVSLYSFKQGSLNRYFYKKNDSKVDQLVYKKYLISDGSLGSNNSYKQQLYNNLECSTIKIEDLEDLDYKKKELVSFFIKYNECNGKDYIILEKKQKKDLFNLNIRPGFSNSSLSIDDSSFTFSNRNANFDNKSSFRFGVEVEFIMAFNKNKWSVIIEPTYYQSYQSEKQLTRNTVKVDYNSVELPIGIRHYFFINESSKIFINGSYVLDFSSNSIIDFNLGEDLEIKTRNNFAFGLGYKYNDKYSLEFRYFTSRNIFKNYVFWRSSYDVMSVIFGYTLF